ncbi:MAG TPA: type VII secretion protein EccB [Trebonia sp.]|jgi:type VII secretion protein EccB
MNSRRDQVQAYTYVMGRLTSALVHGEPDAPETPTRRTSIGTFTGVLLSALLVAGFLIWGLLSPSASASALSSGEFVVTKDTGSRYIYADGALHPVLNWSSAMLLLSGKPTVKAVTAASIADVPLGIPLGINGAPDALPPASSLNKGSWLVCAVTSGGGPAVSLTVGGTAALTRVPADSAAIVQTPDGEQYLIYQGQRMRLDAPWIRVALGLSHAPVAQVSAAWLNAVPAAADLKALSVPDIGAPGPTLGSLRTRVGQVLVVQDVGSQQQYYVAVGGGIVPVTLTQAALLLGDPAAAAAYHGTAVTPVQVGPAAAAAAPAGNLALPDGSDSGAPLSPPKGFMASGQQAPCVNYAGSGGSPALVYAAPPAQSATAPVVSGVTASPQNADIIDVVPGGGALLRPQTAPGVGGSSFYLVTDAGVKYPVPSSEVTSLGYTAAEAARLPAALLGFLPTGPALSLPALGGDQ